MPNLIVLDLDFTEATVDKLYDHGLSESAPDEVLSDEPRFLPIGRQADPGRSERLRMIGRNNAGEMLSIIIEAPDGEGRSLVITGYPSGRRDRERYRQARKRSER